MDERRINILLERYHQGICTESELQELKSWYDDLDSSDIMPIPERVRADEKLYIEQRYNLLLGKIGASSLGYKRKRLWRNIAAASILIIAVAAAIGYFYSGNEAAPGKNGPTSAVYIAKGASDVESRYLRLPDSSVVILHAGSSIELYDSSFSGETREVALTGTAYFDVQHLDNKPFIIHSGKIKITVLGTAFSVNSTGDSVAVTVTRGKVRVEDDSHKISTTLTADQQTVYRPKMKALKTEVVKSVEKVDWIRTGLAFDDETLGSIIQKLETRFNGHIMTGTEDIKSCRISAAIPFDGTESLDDILALICPAIGATYTYGLNGEVLIEGPGCQ